jgi:hypothetical protein
VGRVLRTSYRSAPFILAIVAVVLLLATMPSLGAAQTPGAATTEAQSDPSPTETVAPAEAPSAPPAEIITQSETTTVDGGSEANPPEDENPVDTGEGQSDPATSIEQDTIAPTEPATLAPAEPTLPTAPATAPVEPTLAPTVTPMRTLTPTPRIPNTDTLTPASDMSPVTLQPGQTRQYTYIYAATTPRTGTTIHAELRADGGSADGWLLQAQAGAGALIGSGTTVDVTETGSLTPGSTFPLTIAVQAPANVIAPQTVSLYIGSTATAESGEVERGVPGAERAAQLAVTPPAKNRTLLAPAVTAATPTLSCTSSGTLTGGVKWDCTFSGESTSEKYQLYVDGLTPGWRYQFLNPTPSSWTSALNGWQTPGSQPAPVGAVFTYNGSTPATFTFAMGPGPNVNNPQGSASLYFKNTNPSGNKAGSNTVPLTASLAVPCTPTVSAGYLAFPDSAWNGGSYAPVSQNLGLTFATGTNCSGFVNSWSVQVSGTDMTRTGGGSIPANSISYAGESPGPTGITPVQSDVVLSGSGQTIATGSSSVTGGTTWNAPFSLQPPPDAPPGDYSGTITITVASGG